MGKTFVAVRQLSARSTAVSRQRQRRRRFQACCFKQTMLTPLGPTVSRAQVMLIRWLTSLPRESSMHKLCVFLVPTVALVDQQSETLANQTPLKVRPYRGDMGENNGRLQRCSWWIISIVIAELQRSSLSSLPKGVDFWDREKWQKELAEADCVVMTAEIWKNVLLHAYWTLDQVSLSFFPKRVCTGLCCGCHDLTLSTARAIGARHGLCEPSGQHPVWIKRAASLVDREAT